MGYHFSYCFFLNKFTCTWSRMRVTAIKLSMFPISRSKLHLCYQIPSLCTIYARHGIIAMQFRPNNGASSAHILCQVLTFKQNEGVSPQNSQAHALEFNVYSTHSPQKHTPGAQQAISRVLIQWGISMVQFSSMQTNKHLIRLIKHYFIPAITIPQHSKRQKTGNTLRCCSRAAVLQNQTLNTAYPAICTCATQIHFSLRTVILADCIRGSARIS